MASREVRGNKTRLSWALPKALRTPGGMIRQSLTISNKDQAEVERVDSWLKSIKHSITTEEARCWYYGEPSVEAVAPTPRPSDIPTLKEWIPRWAKLKVNRVLDETLELYMSQLDTMLAVELKDSRDPSTTFFLGDLQLDKITGEDVNNLFTVIKATRKAKDGQSPISDATISRYYACLQNIWTVAIEQDFGVVKNPVLKSGWTFEKPEKDYEGEDEKADEYFEPDQYQRLLELIDPRFRLFVRFMGETGVRIGEATALQVHDFDFDRNKAHIRRAWKLRAKNEGEGRGRPGATKGKRRRWVEVPPHLMVELMKLVEGKPKAAWVFTAAEGGHIRHSNFRNRQWLPAMIKARQCQKHLPTRIDGRNGLEVFNPHAPSTCDCLGVQTWTAFTPHSLRHTYATWCILDPLVSIKLLSEQLGHKDVRTTENTYIHVRTKFAELGTAAAISRTLGHAIEGRLQGEHLSAV